MKPARFEYVVAESTMDAIAALARYDDNARLLAGGQSLVPLLNMRLLRPAAIIDINRIEGLDGIVEEADGVRIGALARYSRIEWSPVVRARLTLLAEAIAFIGDRQVRNRGTLGGSLAQADPTGEMPVAALALDATLVLAGPAGTRRVRAVEFFVGPYTTVLEPAEMIIEVLFPAPRGALAVFAEYARRHGDFAVLSVAATGVPDADGAWSTVRVALGGVADRPIVADRASALLTGTRLDAAAVAAAAKAALEAADPPSDIRASAAYRRHLIPIYVERVLERLQARERAGER